MALTLKRSYLSREEENLIVKLLTIKPVSRYAARKKYLSDTSKSFSFFWKDDNVVKLPYSFGSILIKENLKEFKLSPYPNDEKKEHASIKVSFTSKLRPRQQKKIARLDEYFNTCRTATFCAHTGFGKTLTANYYIAKFSLLTVVLVPTIQLMIQWTKAVTKNLPGCNVSVVGEGYDDDLPLPDVIICMPDRWHKIGDLIRDKVGFLIVDEAHMFCTPTRSIPLLQFEPKYILALTASPQRSDQAIGVLQSLCGLHQVRARYKNPVTVWKFMTEIPITTVKNIRGETNWVGTLKKIVEDNDYNALIVDLVDYLVKNLKKKPLLMCERKTHVTDLYNQIKERGISCDYLMENKNSYHNSSCLLAIMKKAGTGFDEEYACPDFDGFRIDTVVYCNSFRELNGLVQYGGRAFRCSHPLIIHLIVKNSIVENHWYEAKRYYLSKEYLADVTIKTIFPDDIWEEKEDKS